MLHANEKISLTHRRHITSVLHAPAGHCTFTGPSKRLSSESALGSESLRNTTFVSENRKIFFIFVTCHIYT